MNLIWVRLGYQLSRDRTGWKPVLCRCRKPTSFHSRSQDCRELGASHKGITVTHLGNKRPGVIAFHYFNALSGFGQLNSGR